MTIGVLVADDQVIVRAGFRALIDSEPDLAALGDAANGADAVAVTSRTSPDVVLMDERAAQVLAHSALTPLLSLECRAAGQSHPPGLLVRGRGAAVIDFLVPVGG